MEAIDVKRSVGAGSAFTVLDHTTAITLGTTTPSVTIGFGTWLVFGRVVAGQVNASCAGTETLTVALKDASANVIATTSVLLLEGTTLGCSLGTIVLPPSLVNNSSPTMTPDILVFHASLSADPSAGSVTITEAEIIAIKLY